MLRLMRPAHAGRFDASRHRFDALALARQDQARNGAARSAWPTADESISTNAANRDPLVPLRRSKSTSASESRANLKHESNRQFVT